MNTPNSSENKYFSSSKSKNYFVCEILVIYTQRFIFIQGKSTGIQIA